MIDRGDVEKKAGGEEHPRRPFSRKLATRAYRPPVASHAPAVPAMSSWQPLLSRPKTSVVPPAVTNRYPVNEKFRVSLTRRLMLDKLESRTS